MVKLIKGRRNGGYVARQSFVGYMTTGNLGLTMFWSTNCGYIIREGVCMTT